MLSRGQAAPRAVHEDALRKFLRWLVGCPLLDQIFPSGDGATLEEEAATLVAFCDSNWGSESSTGRKSTSGGVIYIVAGSSWYCVKGYSRLQSVIALSSAEAELFAIAEAAKDNWLPTFGGSSTSLSRSTLIAPRPARLLGWKGSSDACDMSIFAFASFRIRSTRTNL